MTSGQRDKQKKERSAANAPERYRDLFEQLPVGYFILDREGTVLDVNRAGLVLGGWDRAELVGKRFQDFVDAEDRGHFFLHFYEVSKSGQGAVCDLTLKARDGNTRAVELRSVPRLDAKGTSVTGCFSVVCDASGHREQETRLMTLVSETERRRKRDAADLARSGHLLQQEVFSHEQTEAVLAETSALFEKVFATAYLAIACLDRDFHFLRVNPAYARAYNQASTFFLDKPYFELYPDDELKERFQQVLNTGEPYTAFAVPLQRVLDDANIMTWWDWNVSTLVDRGGQVSGLLLCLLEVTERVTLEHQIVNISDLEQRRLGQDLHDGMGQLLTAISIKTKILEETVRDAVVPQVQEVGELIREAAIQTRNLSKLLNPRLLEEQGLVAALQSLAVETQRRSDVACDFVWDETVEILDRALANHLYRIAQESVTNALRHGQARTIRLTLNLADGARVLRIVNDGIPFNGTLAGHSDGLGLRGMRYRAELIGATLKIEPGPAGGTAVTCTLAKPSTTELDQSV